MRPRIIPTEQQYEHASAEIDRLLMVVAELEEELELRGFAVTAGERAKIEQLGMMVERYQDTVHVYLNEHLYRPEYFPDEPWKQIAERYNWRQEFNALTGNTEHKQEHDLWFQENLSPQQAAQRFDDR